MGMRPSTYSTALLVLVMLVIFAVPAFGQQMHRVLYNVLFTSIIIVAALAMDHGRGNIFRFAAVTIILESIAQILDLKVVLMLSRTVIFIFFIAIVFGLITQVARRKRVTSRVIMESITGYLMLGVVFSLVVAIVSAIQPGAFGFPAMDPRFDNLIYYQSDFIYYAFVTYSTLGYGEIVPTTPLAKSIAILMSVTGPIYLTVVIAMLVGKFLSHSEEQPNG